MSAVPSESGNKLRAMAIASFVSVVTPTCGLPHPSANVKLMQRCAAAD
jgi:hypothetical protein